MQQLFMLLFLALALFIQPVFAQTTVDTSFYIPVKDSELFVRTTGNADGPLILYLHGGPGGFATLEHETYRKMLEDRFLVAYLDQRGCGRSAAAKDTSLLNMKQYLADLDVVIDHLRDRYGKEKLNLLGESWGGTYGFLYLLKHPEKVQAMASIGGVANGPYAYQNLIAKERSLAKAKLAEASDTVKIRQYRHILSELDRIEASNFADFFADMQLIKHKFPKMLDLDPYRVSPPNGPPSEKVLQRAQISMDSLLTFFPKAEIVNKAFRSDPAYNNLNLLPQLSAIQLPVLVMQGAQDYSIGIDQGKLIYEALGSSEKELHIIEQAGHSPMAENREPSAEALRSFFIRFGQNDYLASDK